MLTEQWVWPEIVTTNQNTVRISQQNNVETFGASPAEYNRHNATLCPRLRALLKL